LTAAAPFPRRRRKINKQTTQPCVDPNKSLGRAQTLVYKNGYAVDRCAATGGVRVLCSSSGGIAAAQAPPPPQQQQAPPPLAPLAAGGAPAPTTYQASFGGSGGGGGSAHATVLGAAGAVTAAAGWTPPWLKQAAAGAAAAPTSQVGRPGALSAGGGGGHDDDGGDEAAAAAAAAGLVPGIDCLGLYHRRAAPTATAANNELSEYTEARLGKPSHLLDGGGAALGRFLGAGGRVLRFACRWQGRAAAASGDGRRRFALAYHLEDDTVEIVELAPSGPGAPSGPSGGASAAARPHNQPGGNVFLRRAPLPKPSVAEPGTGDGAPSLTPLHLLSARRAVPRHLFVTPGDLRVGGSVSVHGRRFALTACDEATRAYYRERAAAEGYGDGDGDGDYSFGGGGSGGGFDAEGAPAAAAAAAVAAAAAARPSLPPHNGIGAPEDTLQNCLHLVPRRPQRDVVRLMNNDGVVLSFEARLAGAAERAAEAEGAAAEARRASASRSSGSGGMGTGVGFGASSTFYAKPLAPPPPPSARASPAAAAACKNADDSPKALAAAANAANAAAADAHAAADRRFVLTYFYADNTVAIQEPPRKNSGVPGGRFLERGVVRKPPAGGGPAAAGGGGSATGEPLTHSDLFVGARVPIHGRVFELTGADKFTLDYMEHNSGALFQAADAGGAAASARAQLLRACSGNAARAAAALREALLMEALEAGGADGEDGEEEGDGACGGGARVTDAGVHRALGARLGVALVAHQAIALTRRAAAGGAGGARVDALMALVLPEAAE